MTITQSSLRSEMRTLFQNLGQTSISDETLDLCISQGLARISRDRPREANYSLMATGVRHSLTSLVSDWKPYFSVVRQVFLPIPDDASMASIVPLDHTGYRVVKIGETYSIYIHQGVSADGALIVYTTPWLVTNVDGAVTTTLPDAMHTAMTWICGHFVALSMSGKAAGSTDKQAPVDFVNFGTKSDSYRNVAREYEKSYKTELGISEKASPVSATRNIDQVLQDGGRYMTHRPRGLR